MSLERRPIDKLNTQIANQQVKISSLGTISGLISGFQTSLNSLGTQLQEFSATPSDNSVFSATTSATAAAGSYSLEVNALARSQSLVAAGRASSNTAISDGVATTITFDLGTISGGTLAAGIYSGATFTSNGSASTSITIDASNNTLQGIRDAINAANMGVAATIVNDGSGTPYRLALTSSNTGVSNSIKITTAGGDGTLGTLLGYDPAGVQNLNQSVAAQNADFKLNGIAISKPSNTVTDAIQGVTLTLNKLTTTPASLTVTRDTKTISTAATGFVDAYNALYNQLKSRSAYGSGGSQGGVLAGDGTLRLMMNQLRSVLSTATSGGTLTSLSQVGVTTQADGSLKLDSAKLSSAITSNFGDVTNLLSGTTGFITRFNAWSTAALTPGGMIDTRTKSLNASIATQNDKISQLENRMSALQKLYTTQYSNLNMMLSNMNKTSAYLTQQFNSTGA
jgi:flagellar hook-associated protein 2